MAETIRVLQVISGIGSGGAEMFLMNMYRNMDHDKVVFDFLLQRDENIYRDELEQYGSQFYRIPPYYKHFFKNRKQLWSILKEGHYSIIHVHANAALYITPLVFAKRLGMPCRIMHSHGTSMSNRWFLLYHLMNKYRLKRAASHRFACSDAAGKWMFGKGFSVVKNAIALEEFSFHPADRAQMRIQLNIPPDCFVVGQVGRLSVPKNHTFTLEVFSQILSMRPNSVLLLVGNGVLMNTLQRQVESLGIEKHVRFLGVRKDLSKLINAFDVFVFPSLYEGLGIAAIEAQANGLPVFCSDAVPSEAIFASNAVRMPLEAGPEEWATQILNVDVTRLNNCGILKKSGYDIRSEAKKLQDFYCSSCHKVI